MSIDEIQRIDMKQDIEIWEVKKSTFTKDSGLTFFDFRCAPGLK